MVQDQMEERKSWTRGTVNSMSDHAVSVQHSTGLRRKGLSDLRVSLHVRSLPCPLGFTA